MANAGIFRKNLEVRLETVEEQLDAIFGRMGLLDEQARQASYHAWLAMVQVGRTGPSAHGEDGTKREKTGKLADPETMVSRRDHRVGRIASKRAAHSSR